MPTQTKEEKKEYNREYRESEKGKKKNTIRQWKHRGLVWTSEQEIEEIYDRWLNSEKCEKKGCEYTETNWKCMDHEHLNGKYGAFRNILCHRCNSNDNSRNTSGTPNISKSGNGWKYNKMKNRKKHQKCFKTKQEAIDYKIEYELKE